MNSELPRRAEASSESEAAPRAKHIHIPDGIGWLFIGLTVLVLAGLIRPTFVEVGKMSAQAKALAQAKAVGLALKLFAGDHDDV